MAYSILIRFLKELGVKHTVSFAERVYKLHPYRFSLYGLSKMLSLYHIPNAGTNIEDKDILKLTTPFIAHVSDDFVIVKDISLDKITYDLQGNDLTLNIEDFKNSWSGIILLAEPQKDSIEPDYSKHLRTERLSNLRLKISIGLLLMILTLCYLNVFIHHNSKNAILLTFNFIGIYISYLLLLKQINSHNTYADRFCSLFHQKKCDHVLESPAAKILWFSWSEIGLGYFISNIIFTVLFPHLMVYFADISIISLFYTIWSLWYQKSVIKQWCVLCLITQFVLLSLSILNCVMGYISIPHYNATHLFTVIMIYTCPIFFINWLVDILSKANKLNAISQELESFKSENIIFLAMLKNQPYYPVNISSSRIIFGNPNAKIGITILTNPHCEPCANMHERVMEILKNAGEKLYVQYIFTAFAEELQNSNRFLIATYFQGKKYNIEKVYSDWYKRGKYEPDKFIQSFCFQMHNAEVEKELQVHEQWRIKNNLTITPTLLVNGYKFPEKYKLEDILYFDDLEIS